MMMSLFTDRRAIKHVTDTRRRTPPAVFRPELQNMDHMKQERWNKWWETRN